MAGAAWKPPASMADAAIDLSSEGQESVALVDSFHSSIPIEFEWMAEDSKFIQENPTTGGSQPGFHFVTETGKSRPGGPVRNLIRSKARRSGQTKINSASASRKEIPHRMAKTLIKSDTEEDLTQVQLIGGRFAYPNPSRGPGDNSIDPFGAAGTGHSNRVYNLLNHYDTVFRQTYCPVEPRGQWVPFCLSDQALLNATLFCSALSLSFLKGKLSSPDIVHFQAKTIKLIKTRLTDEPSRMATDTSMCAVACLAQYENLTANPDGARVHMDGLENMVKTRGGISGLKDSLLAMRLILWVDSGASIVLNKKPRFEPDTEKVEALITNLPYCQLALRYRAKLYNLSGLQHLSDETVEVYHQLCHLTGLKDAASCYSDPKIEQMSYTDLTDYLERRVVRITQSEELKMPTLSSRAIFALFGNAALIHLYIFMRDLPRGLPFLHLLSSRIRDVLENEDTSRLELQYPEMMLWILIMGGMGGMGSKHRAWFAEKLAVACLSQGIVGGNEIAFTLSQFLWSELYLSPVTMGFWNDVAIAQGVGTGFEVRRLTDDVSAAPFNAPPELE